MLEQLRAISRSCALAACRTSGHPWTSWHGTESSAARVDLSSKLVEGKPVWLEEHDSPIDVVSLVAESRIHLYAPLAAAHNTVIELLRINAILWFARREHIVTV